LVLVALLLPLVALFNPIFTLEQNNFLCNVRNYPDHWVVDI
jgi:hypothetical protein